MLFSLLALTLFPLTGTSQPQPFIADLFVDGSNPSCAGGTGSAQFPVCSIGAAIALASPGDTIRIAPGTYVENVGISMDLELVGMGGPDVTIVDGGAAGSVIVVAAASTVRLQGLTITNGSAPIGGGIEFSGDLTLVNSTITGNVATGIGGGGIGNIASGITLDVVNCEITGNQAPMGDGGALFVGNIACRINQSEISGNTAAYYGGGVQFSANNTTSYGLMITDSTVRDNVAGGMGGGVFAGGSTFLLSGSTISGNTTSGAGGGVSAFGTGFEFINSTLSGNTAEYGGGMNSIGNSDPRSLSHTTITANTATNGAGGGIFSTGTGADIEMRNTIIAGNQLLDSTYYPNSGGDTWGSFTTLGHNLIGEGASGVTNGLMNDLVGTPGGGGLDAMLGPLQLNGGPTETHDLLSGSPALDAGDPVEFELVDQRGATRPQGSAPDIGAVEKGTIGSDELCNGDGGDGLLCTPCPCGNDAAPGTIGGCVNSFGTSGRLLRSGTASLASMDLRYEAEGLPFSATAVLLSGSAVAPANPGNPCFGTASGIQSSVFDGLRCVTQNLLRHGVRASDSSGRIGATTNGWGAPNGFFNFGVFTLGETRFFQVVYREDPTSSCQTGLNTTQASSVAFVP